MWYLEGTLDLREMKAGGFQWLSVPDLVLPLFVQKGVCTEYGVHM